MSQRHSTPSFRGRVAVITGAGSGIGRALALQLAGEGAQLALSDLHADAVAETVSLAQARLDNAGQVGRVKGYTVDVSRREAVFTHADEVMRDFGQVDVVINNAGATILGTFEHLSIEEIEWQLQVNLWSVIYGSKAFLPLLRQRPQAWLVNVSSVFGFVSFPAQGAYNIAKFGVRALNECLWRELADTGVLVVSVHPGGIRTNIDKTARMAAAADQTEVKIASMSGQALITPPEDMATAILDGMRRGQRRVVAGHMAKSTFWISRLFPNRYPELMRRLGF